MPRARWGVTSRDVDSFDRDNQYAPYTGPTPGNGVYQFKIKLAKYIPGSREKFPSLRVGLELVPRSGAERDEKRCKGYFIMAFLPVAEKTAFRYVPFLDAIGVSGADFENRTIVDEEGNIQRIGGWRQDGKTLILAQLADGQDQHNNPRKEITWFGPLSDSGPDDDGEFDDSDLDYADDVDEDEDADAFDPDYEDEEEAPPPPRKRTPARTAPRPRRRVEDDDF
jgi:hypothetical protein